MKRKNIIGIGIILIVLVGCQKECPSNENQLKTDLFYPPVEFNYEWLDYQDKLSLCNYNHMVVVDKNEEKLRELLNECENISIYGYVSVRDENYQKTIKLWLDMGIPIGIFLDGIDNVTYDSKNDCFISEYYLGEEKTKELLQSLNGSKLFLNSYKPYDDYVDVEKIKELGLTPPCR